jgi:3-phenylpropionate/cinnamic acid dioxygenase small subunit
MARVDESMNLELRLELEEALIHEYWLLDNNQLEHWLDLICEDIRYWAPVRENLTHDEERIEQIDLLTHFDEDKTTLGLRVARLRTGLAHAEEPPSRTRHCVSNVKILEVVSSAEVVVDSNFSVFRSRPGLEEHWFVGARTDRWLKEESQWLLKNRLIKFDHDVIENITVFV